MGVVREESMHEERARVVAWPSSTCSQGGAAWQHLCPLQHRVIVNSQSSRLLDSPECSCKGRPVLVAAIHGEMEWGGHDAKEPVAQDYHRDGCFGVMVLRGTLGIVVAVMELGGRSKGGADLHKGVNPNCVRSRCMGKALRRESGGVLL